MARRDRVEADIPVPVVGMAVPVPEVVEMAVVGEAGVEMVVEVAGRAMVEMQGSWGHPLASVEGKVPGPQEGAGGQRVPEQSVDQREAVVQAPMPWRWPRPRMPREGREGREGRDVGRVSIGL